MVTNAVSLSLAVGAPVYVAVQLGDPGEEILVKGDASGEVSGERGVEGGQDIAGDPLHAREERGQRGRG